MAREALLASWNDTPTRAAITGFVATCDDMDPREKIAVFDNDGTLWTEKPLPIQLDFAIGRLAELASADPELAARQPYQAALAHDVHWLGEAMVKHYHGDDQDLGLLLNAVERAFEGLDVEEFGDDVTSWFRTATHPTLHRPYLTCAFTPMVELLRYLEANDFTVYIASGGDRDFMRPFAEDLYGVPPERIVGSALGLTFDVDHPVARLVYGSKIEFFDDGPSKPVRIWSRIGRRPLFVGGNSNGDMPMMQFARTDERAAFRLLVRHDDAEREFDYVTGAEDVLAHAQDRGWTIASIKDDWATVFPL